MTDESQVTDQAEQADTHALETRYRRLFESARDGILILDGQTRKITDANPSMAELVGMARQQLIGQELGDLGITPLAPQSLDLFDLILEKGTLRFESTLRGSVTPTPVVEVVANVYQEGTRQVVQCNVRDVTQRFGAEANHRFQALLLNTVGQAVIATNLEGIITHWNHAAESLYGWSAQEAIGQLISSLVVPISSLYQASEIMAKLRRGESWADEFNVQRRDGFVFPVWVNNTPLYDDAGELIGIVGVSSDFSERKRLETAQAQLASIVETSNDAIFSMNLDGQILTWNDGAKLLYGYEAAEVVGQPFALIFPSGQPQKVDYILDLVRGGEPIKNMEMARGRKSQSLAPKAPSDGKRHLSDEDNVLVDVSLSISPLFDGRGELIGASAIARDIAAQKRQHEDSLRTEKLYRTLAQNFPNGAVYLLDLEGRFFLAEGRGLGMVGLKSEDLVGKFFEEALGDNALSQNLRLLHQRALQGEETVSEIEFRGRCRSARAVPVRNEQNEISFVLVMSQDITERKQVEAELERSNREIRTIWESMTDAFCAIDTSWRFTHMNSQAAKLLHVNAEEIIGKNVWEEFPQALDLAFYPELNRAVKEQSPVVFEEFFAPLGKWFELHAYPSPLGISVYFRDITERKNSEQTLRASEARFQGIVSNVPGMVYQFVLHPDGTMDFPFVSEGCLELVGLTAEEIRANPSLLLEIIHPEDRDYYARTVAESVATLEPWTWEGRGKLPSGQIKWVQGVSRPRPLPDGTTLWDGLLVDITARREAEDERDRFFTLSLDMLAIVDPRGYFKRINPAFEATLGYSSVELIAMPFLDLVHPDDKEATQAEFEKLNSGVTTLNFVNRNLCKDGSVKWLSWHAVPFENLFYIVAHDITPLVEAEAALRRANEELELRVAERTAELAQANEDLRVENVERQMTMAALRHVAEAYRQAKEESDAANNAKSEFLSRMSHELRTPLNAILGFGQILQTGTLLPEEQEQVSQILHGGWHLLDLINEILDISRVEAGHMEMSLEPICLSDVIIESCSLVRPLAAQRNITLDESAVVGEAGYAIADRQRLKQVLINLISNGIKYNRPGGQVTLFCELASKGRVRIAVRDTGLGLAQSEKEKLFTPFERLAAVNSEIEGTGLGLVLSKHLVTAMGGILEVESQVGQGSTFWIELALASAPEGLAENAAQTPVRNQESAGAVRSYTVLSIEDNDANQQLLEDILSYRPEITLLTASNGSAGLDLAFENHPDLVLLDLNLPDISGQQVLSQLRQTSATANIPVIIVSADATKPQIERLLGAGASAYVTKPINVPKLLGVLNEALRSQHKVEEENVPVEETLPEETSTTSAKPNSLRILVAEDNPVNQKVVSHQLRNLGHEAVVHDNGQAVVEAWKQGQYDIILMDCHMPVMDGYTATREIRRQEGDGERIPIVALTANALVGDREKSLAAGMDDHLSKPVRQAELAAALTRWTANASNTSRGDARAENSPNVSEKDPILYMERWNELIEELDRELLDELVNLFLQETPPIITALHDVITERDAGQIRSVAHKLKGSSSTLGAARFADICRRIETLAEQGQLDESATLSERLPQEFSRLQAALMTHLGN